MIYFISDMHFDDKNVLMYFRPEFDNIEDMNDLIINNWNKIVTDKDTIYILGDIGNYKYLKMLKGNKIIILGNHDNAEDLIKIQPNIKFYDKPIILDYMFLSHEPIPFLTKQIPYLNIHGHLHNFNYRENMSINWYDGNRYFNVSCENINYTPISLNEIIKIIGYISM